MGAKKIYRLDATESHKYPYIKTPRTKDCQATIRQELYDAANDLAIKKGLTWIPVIENGLRRFIDENKGYVFEDGVTRIRPLHEKVAVYQRVDRDARFLTRIQLDLWNEANEFRMKKKRYTWVYVIESILEKFLDEK